MSAPTPDFALGYRALMLDGFAREVETTKKVLAAGPTERRTTGPTPTHAQPGNWPGTSQIPTTNSWMGSQI